MHTMGLGMWIARRARMTPSKAALIFEGTPVSYSELNIRITRFARGLRSLGLQRDDRIGYLGSNHPAFIETMFAAATLGAVFVPLHVGFSRENIAHCINDAGCRLLVYGPDMTDILNDIRPDIRVETCLAIGDPDRDDPTVASIMEDNSLAPIIEDIGFDDLCLISYTSGTTGLPKGVVLTHGNLTWNVCNFMTCADYCTDDVILVQAPLYRMGGLGVLALPGLFKGATLVLASETEPGRLMDLIDRYKVTVLFGGPDFFRSLLAVLDADNRDIPSVRFCICGGDIIPEPLIRTWLDHGIHFQQGYGLTEASPMLLLLDKKDMLAKIGSSGRPPLFTEVRVVRMDFSDVEPGEVGEIVARGPNIMKGYWKLPEVTALKITPDGWLRTGDAARVDHDGYIYVLGRIDDAIDLGGRMLLPAEIEKVIVGYAEVADCAIAGSMTNGAFDLTAFIVRASDARISEAELLSRFRADLSADRIPKHIHFVDSIPRNPNGKIIRQLLPASVSTPSDR
jgi:fatty-acyl-CoA synthase